MFVTFSTIIYLMICSCHATRKMEETRIVGGRPTSILSHPYQLVLRYHRSFICGAVLIKSDAAITAGHCVKLTNADGKGFSIRAGSTFHFFGGVEMEVKRAVPHPKFEQYDYDIAALKLENDLPLSRRIQPIPISPISGDNFAGKLAEVSGWGVTIPFLSHSTSPVLQDASLTVVSRRDCRSYTGYEFITDRMICAIGTNGVSDSCQGDSGGPLVHKDFLIGLVSFGRGCSTGIPGVYTDVTKFSKFIESNT